MALSANPVWYHTGFAARLQPYVRFLMFGFIGLPRNKGRKKCRDQLIKKIQGEFPGTYMGQTPYFLFCTGFLTSQEIPFFLNLAETNFCANGSKPRNSGVVGELVTPQMPNTQSDPGLLHFGQKSIFEGGLLWPPKCSQRAFLPGRRGFKGAPPRASSADFWAPETWGLPAPKFFGPKRSQFTLVVP